MLSKTKLKKMQSIFCVYELKIRNRKNRRFLHAGGNLFPRPQKPLVFAGIKTKFLIVFDATNLSDSRAS